MKSKLLFHKKLRGITITKLISRDGDNCWLCGGKLDRRIRDFHDKAYVTFDHVVPRSAGGVTRVSNLRLAHQSCNNQRGNDPVEEMTT